jgi:hypothetical protein
VARCDGLPGDRHAGSRCCFSSSLKITRTRSLGANNTNTTADHAAIDAEAEALADEFHRLMDTSNTRARVSLCRAGSEYVSMGGRDAEMTFGIGTVSYAELHNRDQFGPQNLLTLSQRLLVNNCWRRIPLTEVTEVLWEYKLCY